MNAAVNVRFGRNIDDGAGLMLGKQFGDKVEIAGVALQRGDVLEVASVGEYVEVDDSFIGLCQPVEDEFAADKATAPVTRIIILLPPQ